LTRNQSTSAEIKADPEAQGARKTVNADHGIAKDIH
jgi:hypothetical protein